MILKYLRPREWTLILLSVMVIAFEVYLELEIPGYMTDITTALTTGGSTDTVIEKGMRMLACAFGSLVLSVIVGFSAAFIASSLSRRLREMEFDSVQSFSESDMDRFSTASLITRSTNDITQIQNAVAVGMMMLIRAPIMAIWAITKIADKNWDWTLATSVAIIAILILVSCIFIFVVPRFRRIQSLTDNVNRIARENLTGIRVVRAYNAESHQRSRFEHANGELTENNLFANRAMSLMMPSMSLIMNTLGMCIYWIGAILIDDASPSGRISLFSDMIVFSSYSMMVIMAFIMLVALMIILPRASVAAKRVEEVIDTRTSIEDGTECDPPCGSKGSIQFENVSFRYDDAKEFTLRDISFTASQGETVAFIGSTGSGKSTLVKLIPRFADATEGRVLVDGMDVRRYRLDSLRRRIGYVPQKSILFGGSIGSNIGYGDSGSSITEEDIQSAIDTAQASEFIGDLEDGLDSMVSQSGTNLSGGQRQRISVARAVCRSPEIFIFDDTFSALDYRTDRALRTALKERTEGITCLIVAQRIGTVMDADRIIVLDEGRIVGTGTHEQLLRECDTYREIALSQLSEEELVR